jgi:hypothetical protein
MIESIALPISSGVTRENDTPKRALINVKIIYNL